MKINRNPLIPGSNPGGQSEKQTLIRNGRYFFIFNHLDY